MKKRLLTFFAIIFAMLTFVGCSLFSGENLQREVLSFSEQEKRIQVIAETYPDAVVTVFTYEKESTSHISLGSGVVIKDNGFIATNYHVISNAVDDLNYELKVAFNNSSELYPASIEWFNAPLDLSVIKVNLVALDFVPMKDRSFDVEEENHYYAGESVIAIGTPLNFSLQNTVTVGRISSKTHRMTYAEGNVYQDLIQHTALINRGNSGGGLFDLDGNLIALNTLGNDTAHGIFFAVPIYPIIQVLDSLVEAYSQGQTYKTGTFGIIAVDRYQASYFEDIEFNDAGLIVLDITENKASYGKLLVGDVIKKIKVGDKETAIDIRNNFIFAILKTTKNTTVSLKVERGASLIDINITLD